MGVQGPPRRDLARERLDHADVVSRVRAASRGLADVPAGVGIATSSRELGLRTSSRWSSSIRRRDDRGRAARDHRQRLVGTPAYMAPEQLLGDEIDARTDLYALSLVLYRVIVGRPAFTQQRVSEPNSTPADPYAMGDLPIALCHALRVGLAVSPGDRFQTATELEAAFEAALDGRSDDLLATRARSLATREPWT